MAIMGGGDCGLGDPGSKPTADRYRFCPATPEDAGLLKDWRQATHVRQWWGETEAFNQDDLLDPRVAMMIVDLDGRPFAYLQDYDVHGWDGHHFDYLPAGSRGIDQFIGEPDMIGQGHGTAFIRARVLELLAAGAPVIGTDPHPDNARAIRAYEKVGFKVMGPEEDTEWGRVIRMELWAPQPI